MTSHRTVLLACPYLPPVGGGLERYVSTLGDELEAQGDWRVVFAASTAPGSPSHVRREIGGRVVHLLAAQVKWSNTPFSGRWLRQLRTIIRDESVALVNAHAPVVGMADMAAFSAGDLPFVLTYHAGPMRKGSLQTDLAIWSYENGLRRLMVRRADQIICSSDWVRDCLGRDALGKAHLVLPGVDADRFSPGTAGPGDALLFVGRLDRSTAYKGVSRFLAMIAGLRAQGLAVSAQIVGDGDAREDYVREARERGVLAHVTFSGQLDGEQLVEAYRSARAIVLPTSNDSTPLVLLEAMACGIPAVSTSVGGIPTLIGADERGFLVDPQDLGQLVERTARLVTDRALAARLGRAARAEVVARFSQQRQGEATCEVFEEAIRARSADRRRTVAVVAPYFPPKIGGLERYSHQVATAVRGSANLNPIVITSNHRRRRTEIEWVDDIPVIRFGNLFRLSNTPMSPLWAWRVPHALRRHRVDLVNTHAPVPYIADIAIATAGRRPVVATYHAGSMVKERSPLNGLIRLYENQVLPRVLARADTVVAVSPASFAAHLPGAVTIMPGVDETLFVPAPTETSTEAQPGVSADRPTVLYVGRIDRTSSWKGISTLLDAMALVVAELPDVRLRLVGDGDALADYRATADAVGLGASVVFSGALAGRDLVAAYQQATVVVLPSLTNAESFGMTLIEGMACGRPVVGSRVGGIGHVVTDRKDGLLVPPGDPGALADALLSVVRDPAWAEALGCEGRRKVVEKYRSALGSDSYVEIFENLSRGQDHPTR